MLPLENAEAFARRIVEFAPDVVVTQYFHDSGGGFGADTSAAARTAPVDGGRLPALRRVAAAAEANL
jgi:hypothetical protein